MGVLKVRFPAGAWTPITGVGGGWLTMPEADMRYVLKTGDTMTGSLKMQGPAGTEQIKLSSAADYIGFWDGGTTRNGYIQGNNNGLVVASDRGNLLLMGPGSGGEVTLYGGGQPMLHVIGSTNVQVDKRFDALAIHTWGTLDGALGLSVDNGSIQTSGSFRSASAYMCTNNTDTDSGLYWWSDGKVGLVSNGLGTLSVLGSQVETYHLRTIDGYRIYSLGSYNGAWDQAAFIAQRYTYGDRAHITFHIPGVWAGGFGSTGSGGFGVWNNGSSGYETLTAYLVNASSKRFKQDIAPWKPRSLGSAVLSPADRLSLIDVVSYRPSIEQAMSMPDPNGGSLDRLHDCALDDCEGDADAPCSRVIDWENPHLSVVIEDLATVLPEAVALVDGRPEGMRIDSMIGFLLAVCKEQQERIEQLEHQQEAA